MTRSRASAKAGRTTLAQRMWSRAVKQPGGCWEWQGYRMPSGHGQIGIPGRRVTTTHRVAWEIANGRAIPQGLMVRHRCDNPPCINPKHLEIGTAADNSRDAVERGRVARGISHPHTRLSEAQVIEIRARYRRFTVPGLRGYRSNRDYLASEYGVSGKYIVAIAGRRERTDA